MIQQQVKIGVVPPVRGGGPGPFQTAGHRMFSISLPFGVHPAETLVFEGGCFRTGTQHGGVAVAMCFAHRMATGRKGYRFLVVHGHSGEGGSHILCCAQGIRLAVDPFGIHIDETHLNGRQGILKRFPVFIVGVAVFGGSQPLLLSTPVYVLLRMPDVFTAAAETKGPETHRFIGHVSRQDKQVGPGELVPVFLLDRP